VKKLIGAALIVAQSSAAPASETITVEPDGDSYHFVSHYSVAIDAPAEAVWEHLVRLDSWMYELDMSLVSGSPGQEGEVRRLYAGQDFLVQVTKVIPNELLVVVNLPSTFNGEHSTGIVVTTLHEAEGTTAVDMTMSRRYTWQGDGENPMKRQRESKEFAESTKAMWQDGFLGRLRSLAEGRAVGPACPGEEHGDH
jgi:hypothetical protein